MLVGGFGTRLRPLTYTRPKHLLPIANRPHIEHVLDMLSTSGIKDAVLLTAYLADAFSSLNDSARDRGMNLEIVHEVTPLDTAGALKNAAGIIGSDTFVAINADVLSDLDVGAVIDWHRSHPGEGTIVLTPVDDPSAFGVVPTDADGKVLGFIEKPDPSEAPTNMINAGVYVLEPTVLERIPPNVPVNAERRLFPQLAVEGALYATPTDAYWMDIGTPEKYLRANLDALRGRFKTDAAATVDARGVLAAPGAAISPSADVTDTCVGAGVRIGEDAVVRTSVLLPNSVVGNGARITSCILGEGASIASGTELAGTAIADGRAIS